MRRATAARSQRQDARQAGGNRQPRYRVPEMIELRVSIGGVRRQLAATGLLQRRLGSGSDWRQEHERDEQPTERLQRKRSPSSIIW